MAKLKKKKNNDNNIVVFNRFRSLYLHDKKKKQKLLHL